MISRPFNDPVREIQDFPLLQACRVKAGLEPLPDDAVLTEILVCYGLTTCDGHRYVA